MMLELLTAIRFEKVMGSGRTQPCLLVCENEAGEEVEVVAKMRGHPQIMPGGLLAEAVASLSAARNGHRVTPSGRGTRRHPSK